MKERVDALNKVEELEHVNMQLQNECDTIGKLPIHYLYTFPKAFGIPLKTGSSRNM